MLSRVNSSVVDDYGTTNSQFKRCIDTFSSVPGHALVVQPVIRFLAIVEVQEYPSPVPHGI
jgi:hypothetical protein